MQPGWPRSRSDDAGEFDDGDYMANPTNRCFFCKTNLYGSIARHTRAQIVSGANTDDLGEDRPGLDAARKAAVRHPYLEAAIDKCGGGARSGRYALHRCAGPPDTRRAITDLQRRRFGLDITARNVMVVPGAQNGLFSTSLCLFEPDDELIVLEPMYVTYEATFEAVGARLVPVPPGSAGFRLDAEAIRRAVTPRTRAIAFATPSNPTGMVMSRG